MNNHSEQEKLSETTNQNTNQNKQTEFSRQEDPSGARQGERLEEVKITKRRSRYRRVEDKPGMILMERDKEVVMAVWKHRFLRRDQIERLFFTQASACNKRLIRLFQHGYLDRIFKPVVFGGCQAVYVLDKEGANLVAREQGVDPRSINWKRKNRVEMLFMDHVLAVSEFYVKLVTLVRQYPDVKIISWERESKELQAKVSDPEGKRKYLFISPDAFFSIETPKGRSYFFLEADLGTMTLSRFKDKVVAYRQYWKSGQFTDKHGHTGFRLVTIAESEKRLANLERVTREAGGKNMFLFLHLDSDLMISGSPFWI